MQLIRCLSNRCDRLGFVEFKQWRHSLEMEQCLQFILGYFGIGKKQFIFTVQIGDCLQQSVFEN